jgi:hypothetical protein
MNNFLSDLPSRPLNLSDPKGTAPRALFLGNGPNAVEVAVVDAVAQPTLSQLRAIWSSRLAGRATPVLAVVLYGKHSALCGPTGDPPPAFTRLEPDRVERLCRAALAEPDRNAALRFLHAAIPEAEAPLPGVRNQGLFATHELQKGLPRNARWQESNAKASPLLAQRGAVLLHSLGYTIEAAPGPISILRAGETRRAVAVFLDRDESPDLPSSRFAQLSPVSYALARADHENLDWVIVSAGPVLRLHPVGTNVGTGRRSRTETFAEVHLDLLSPAEAAYLWLIFSAEALRKDGDVAILLDKSRDFATELGARLRERVYSDVVPDLALAILAARGLKRPTQNDLAETFQMTLVYLFRLIFVAYAEDKDLLPYRHNERYRSRSLKQKARELADMRRNGTVFGKGAALWEEIDLLFKAVDQGKTDWGVPGYNGGLFSRDSAVSRFGALLSEIELPDPVVGPILTNLLVDSSTEGWGPVDFRSLTVQEFGTIYEGLLENDLAIAESDLTTKTKDKQYAPAGPKDKVEVQKGRAYLHNTSGARKSTGSYFTKHFAVEHLLDHALEPALEEHAARLDALTDTAAAEAFFDFRVADIAMGSAHFLVAAVDRIERRLGNYLAKRPLAAVHDELDRLRDFANESLGLLLAGNIDIEKNQLLRRQIARRCIYGVDLNPIAVDLARLAIWIHTFVPGLPLSFLDHNLVQGNALVGIGTLKEANDALDSAGSLLRVSEDDLRQALAPLEKLAALSDVTPGEIKAARKAFAEARKAVEPVRRLFDVLTAARLGQAKGFIELTAFPDAALHAKVTKGLEALPAFHFPVAFPEVFLRKRAGFDVLLGNPPWEEATVEEDRFWTRHQPGFHSLKQKEQEALKKKLRLGRPDLVKIYEEEKTHAELLRHVLTSGAYPGMGTGDPDTYKAFYWRFWELLAPGTGWAGIVLPRNAMSAKGSSDFRKQAFAEGQFGDMTWLLNRQGWVFEDVEPRYTIVLTAFTKRPATQDQSLPFRGPFRSLERYEVGVKNPALRFRLAEIGAWTDIWALPLLPSEDSGDVFVQLRKSPRLDAKIEGSWRARPQRELDATNDKPLMKITDAPPEGYWPIFKGESFDIWEPDTGSYYAWGNPTKLMRALQEKRLRSGELKRSAFQEFTQIWRKNPKTLPCFAPRIAFRDVTRATDTRTVRAALLPGEVFIQNTAPFVLWPYGDEADQAFLLGVICSVPLD